MLASTFGIRARRSSTKFIFATVMVSLSLSLRSKSIYRSVAGDVAFYEMPLSRQHRSLFFPHPYCPVRFIGQTYFCFAAVCPAISSHRSFNTNPLRRIMSGRVLRWTCHVPSAEPLFHAGRRMPSTAKRTRTQFVGPSHFVHFEFAKSEI